MEQVRAVIVEDKAVVAEDLRLCLQGFGYATLGICNNGHDAIDMVTSLAPDILLMDININGPIDGVETVRQINEVHALPVIYLTAYIDEKTVERAKRTHPAAYLVKPFDPVDLKIAIDIAIENFQKYASKADSARSNGKTPLVRDSLFVKQGDTYQKVPFDRIDFVEADGSYTKIHTPESTLTISMNMKNVQANLPSFFLKVHRSFVVNINKVTGFDSSNIFVNKQVIPVSQSNKEMLAERFLRI